MANSVSRRLLLDEAKRRGWKTETLGANAYFLKITDPNGRSEIIRGTQPGRTSANGFLIAKYKQLTMSFMESQGYEPLPYMVPDSFEEALAFMFEHRSIVVKPVDGYQSKGVKVNVRDVAQLHKATETARAYSHSKMVMLQPFLTGNLYRIMTLNGACIGAVQRKAAEVIGDGVHNIRWLIEQANLDLRRGLDNASILKKISLSEAIDLLGRDVVKSTPAAGERVRVNAIDSVSAGGEAINVSDKVHSTWKKALVELADKAGLFICGYDVMCDDISRPMPIPVPLLEMNSMPGLKLMHYPTGGGDPIDVAGMLLDALFGKKST